MQTGSKAGWQEWQQKHADIANVYSNVLFISHLSSNQYLMLQTEIAIPQPA